MGLGVHVFYAYDESIVSKEETANDMSKIFVTILHAFKRNQVNHSSTHPPTHPPTYST